MKIYLKTQENSLRAVIMLFLLFTAGCAAGTALRTEEAASTLQEGQFRIYLYGCHHADDLENMALIVDEQAPFHFNLFVPDTSYRIVPPQPFDRALEQADRFLRCGMRTVTKTQIRRIIGPAGETAGYEMLPLYVPYEIGTEEAVQVNYSLKNNMITVYVRLAPLLELRESFPDIPSSPGTN